MTFVGLARGDPEVPLADRRPGLNLRGVPSHKRLGRAHIDRAGPPTISHGDAPTTG
jgi:hypothetical protein